MKFNILFSTLALCSVLSTAQAETLQIPAGVPLTTVEVSAEQVILAASSGMSVYTFDLDTSTASACNGKCAEIWPPILLTVAEEPLVEAPFGIITRQSGLKQLTFNGKALYFFYQDRVSLDILGDNFNNFWHVVPAVQ